MMEVMTYFLTKVMTTGFIMVLKLTRKVTDFDLLLTKATTDLGI